jgi:hypothetical protein
MLYDSNERRDKPAYMIFGPYSAPTIRDEVLYRFRTFSADPQTPKDVFVIFFSWHPFYIRIWDVVVAKRLRCAKLDSDAPDELRQGMRTSLIEIIYERADLHAWLNEAEAYDFYGWSFKLIYNLGAPELHCQRRAKYGTRKHQRVAPQTGDFELEPDRHVSEQLTAEQRMDIEAKLDGLPELTRKVFWLRFEGYSWDDVAEKLGISLGEAKWAWRPFQSRFGVGPALTQIGPKGGPIRNPSGFVTSRRQAQTRLAQADREPSRLGRLSNATRSGLRIRA